MNLITFDVMIGLMHESAVPSLKPNNGNNGEVCIQFTNRSSSLSFVQYEALLEAVIP